MNAMFQQQNPDWPPLPFAEWENTCDTVHMWTQIVGKTRMAKEPLLNHWWNVALYVTPVGLTTSSIPYKQTAFEIEFDFVSHQLRIRTRDGERSVIGLYARSVADFYREYMSALSSLGVKVRINRTPAEFDDTTPYDEDHHHASYDVEYVERFRRILIATDRTLKEFRTRFLGKSSQVHFFWGSFDLAVTRFSGRPVPDQPNVDPITREAYSHEVISCGFWPGDRRFKNPAFYSYSVPAPPGLALEPVRPKAAHWDQQLGEFILAYDDVRITDSPRAAILEFCQSTYEAGAKLANWDRTALERFSV
jgi:Family of unknown function (DUF5996)